ncbi:Ni/Fe hydrogenase subunit alpha [Desulfopila aestuarii]|uniref:NAD(P)-dependent nickel-iron dehydrogenase catalytic subunit n=1 Tax=Desulfopila aestuarii DSM 18488 TaxID=1121416 RepID=A0A1M7YKQ4_9BACT|nr:Ni/Fe hydrogenase subunit alpha [Desulfopila aestuarii]SHO53203.1 NAD(P)-dependent nickel-iron dehydrogenase catalytic subunit [Desulfopila aestuarii DSM 18488]
MSQQFVIEPVSRIEGHGKITITLDDLGQVADARLHVTQFRGFEKFCEGRPLSEMVSLVQRICGICPISHSLASAKVCDAIMGVRVPDTAIRLRRLLNCGEFIQSHALSFFYLSSPDLLLGLDSPPAERNILGLMKSNPTFARDGIRLRRIGQQMIEWLAGKRIHPTCVVPGGVNAPLSPEHRQAMQELIPEGLEIVQRTLLLFKNMLDSFREEIDTFANFPTYFMGLVDSEGRLEHVDGKLRVIDADGNIVIDQLDCEQYQEYIGEAVEEDSFLKSPYYKPLGYPDGIYRVGPAARLNVISSCGTPLADQELVEFRGLSTGPVLSAFHNHYARLIEILYSLEMAERLLADPDILNDRIRAFAQPNYPEGIGVVEAPRGTLFHHYKADDHGLITWVNLIVATGNNNLAMNRGLFQVARHYLHSRQLTDDVISRLQAVIRAFDPCLSCSTHSLGEKGIVIELITADGRMLDSF